MLKIEIDVQKEGAIIELSSEVKGKKSQLNSISGLYAVSEESLRALMEVIGNIINLAEPIYGDKFEVKDDGEDK